MVKATTSAAAGTDTTGGVTRPTLDVPEPGFRHGEPLSFSHLHLAPAGAARRPELSATSEEVRDLSLSLIRVLDDEHQAVGPWAGGLTTDELCDGLRDMLLVRAFDARMLRAQRQGKTSFYVQCLGEEAIATAHRRAQRADDMNFPTYRQQGLLIAGGYPLVQMINQVYSNSADPLLGHQLPVMYSSRAHGYFSVSGNLATQLPQAVGWAMASAISKAETVVSGWIGDGSTAESDFHAAMVFASTYKPPFVLNIVNNQWAISTFQGLARGQAETFASRGFGFGIPALRVDGNDYIAVHAASKWAIDRARAGYGPSIIEWVTYRVGAHSTSDDPSAYRPKDEALQWPLGDPVARLRDHLIALGAWSTEQHETAVAEAEAAVAAADDAAMAHGTLRSDDAAAPAMMFDHLYADPPAHLRRQRQRAGF